MDAHLHKAGKVYFVGAGPSDIGLLTLKGRHAIGQADAVIYDALVGTGILGLIPPSAERIPVGKRAGQHSMKQEEISRLIVKKALEGKTVVRLKGGDPFLFGRGGEELELLLGHQIPYEIVPGVTSAIAVPAYAGIPVTHRGMASSVHIMAGHRKQDEPLGIDFEALLRAGGTYVFLMGYLALHEIVQGFLEAGMPSNTPAAIVQDGTGAGQKSAIASLAALEAEAQKQQIGTPAVIVVGEVAALGKRFAWCGKLPLSQSRILVTRPASRSGKLADSLRGLGAEVLEVPMIRTQIRDCAGQLGEVLSRIKDYGCMVFTSPAGVEYFFELLGRLGLDIRCIGQVKLAVIGNATGDELRKRGLMPDLVPEHYNGTALGKLINQSMQEDSQVLLLRSSMGSAALVREIQEGKRIQVTDFAVYDTVYTQEERETQDGTACHGDGLPDIRALIENRQIEMVMFTSASTVRGFVKMAKGLDFTKVNAVCIGQMTAGQAAGYGMRVHLASEETMEGMARAAVALHKSGR